MQVEILRNPAKQLVAALGDRAKAVLEGATIDLPADVASQLVQVGCAVDRSPPPQPVLRTVAPRPEIAEAVPPIVAGSCRIDEVFRKKPEPVGSQSAPATTTAVPLVESSKPSARAAAGSPTKQSQPNK